MKPIILAVINNMTLVFTFLIVGSQIPNSIQLWCEIRLVKWLLWNFTCKVWYVQCDIWIGTCVKWHVKLDMCKITCQMWHVTLLHYYITKLLTIFFIFFSNLLSLFCYSFTQLSPFFNNYLPPFHDCLTLLVPLLGHISPNPLSPLFHHYLKKNNIITLLLFYHPHSYFV